MTSDSRTIVMVVIRVVVALCVGFVVLVAVATFARPEPGPCHGTKDGKSLLALCSPPADTRLVLTSGVAATLLTWFGSGMLQRRLVRA
jgi:hypothetical protein